MADAADDQRLAMFDVERTPVSTRKQEEYGPVVTVERLREAIKVDGAGMRFHPRVRLVLQQYILLSPNEEIDFLCELIKISGECHEV